MRDEAVESYTTDAQIPQFSYDSEMTRDYMQATALVIFGKQEEARLAPYPGKQG
jgi:hypothetical protein